MISYVCVSRILKGRFDITIKFGHIRQNSLFLEDVCALGCWQSKFRRRKLTYGRNDLNFYPPEGEFHEQEMVCWAWNRDIIKAATSVPESLHSSNRWDRRMQKTAGHNWTCNRSGDFEISKTSEGQPLWKISWLPLSKILLATELMFLWKTSACRWWLRNGINI